MSALTCLKEADWLRRALTDVVLGSAVVDSGLRGQHSVVDVLRHFELCALRPPVPGVEADRGDAVAAAAQSH